MDFEAIAAQAREELRIHPDSTAIIPTRESARAIDMSGIFRMTPEQLDAALAAASGRTQ